MPKTKKWSKTVEAHGVTVRLFERHRGGFLYREVRGVGGKADGKDRRSLGHSDRTLAETQAKNLARALAEARLMGVGNGSLTLGQLFTAYRQHRLPTLQPARRREAKARMAMFLDAWGRSMNVLDLSQTHVDAYVQKRRALEVLAPAFKPDPETGKPQRGYRKPRPIRDGAIHGELSWLSTCFNFARGFKVHGRRLLSENPLHGLDWPREKNPRRPVASHQRYTDTMKHVDQVDPQGRLRCILALARFTGRRESAICGLRASDLLLSADRIRRALAAEGMDERLVDHMPHGAIRWSPETDKEGFLFVTPISRQAREALDAYLRQNPRMGNVSLFPAPGPRPSKKKPAPAPKGPEKPISRDLAAAWLVQAEELAELPKLVGGVFHPYRRLWATERKHLADADVAAAGGWKDTRALKASYQQADGAGVLAVVQNGA
jgi:integrase